MDKASPDNRIRLTATENNQLMDICAAYSLFELKPLEKRLRDIKQGPMWAGQVRSALHHIVESVMMTMPENQLKSLQRNMPFIKINARIKNVGKEVEHDGYYMDIESIDALFAGCDDHCLMCDKSTITMKRCAIRKAAETVPVETYCMSLEDVK